VHCTVRTIWPVSAQREQWLFRVLLSSVTSLPARIACSCIQHHVCRKQLLCLFDPLFSLVQVEIAYVEHG
jgi:hypothetical protein